MITLEQLHGYMGKRIRVTDPDGKVFTGLCWGVYSGVENEDDDGIAEDSMELYDGACSIVFYTSDIKSIELLDDRRA
jgi:hypothetical protein